MVRVTFGVCGVSLKLLDLQYVAVGMEAEHEQPLVAVEVAEGDVGEEVAAQVGIDFGGEGYGAGAGAAELFDQNARFGPLACGTDDFASLELSAPRFIGAEGYDTRLFRRGLRLLFWLGWTCERVGDCLGDEGFEEDEVLDVFGDRPAIGIFVEMPLLGTQTCNLGEQTGLAGGESIEDKLAIFGIHEEIMALAGGAAGLRR